ncbi:MAG: DUF6308 family protein [Actinomycetota bacterium]|nr:DUF6308 family protein [Actinomycetota bacterium]MDA3015969.1 DUF6308 family protein [Actinomycetota bacterium]MDA3028945.1 DUF6308 family protein [Actinomycetota bacterium]
MSDAVPWPETGQLGVDGVIAWLCDPATESRIKEHLHRYFGANPDDAFSGRFFESFSSKSERQDRFSPYDVLAAESLSVSIPSDVVDWLLEPDTERDELLSECVSLVGDDNSVGIWSCDESWLSKSSPFSRLYDTFRRPGLGPTKRSKLLATKLPSMVPIRDSLVEDLLDLKSNRSWWGPIRRVLTEGHHTAWKVLSDCALPHGAPDVSVLRRLDVVLWMEARSRGLGRRRSSR